MPQLELLLGEDKNPLDLAYIAGLFDGEGTASIIKHGNTYSLHISIQMNITASLDVCQATFGSKIYRKKQRTPYKDAYEWVITGTAGYRFLKAIRPYLKSKADVADICIEFFNQYGKHETGKGHPIPRIHIRIAEDCRQRLKLYHHPNRGGKKKQ